MFDVIYGVVHICSMLCDVLKAYSMDARPTKFPLFLSVGTEAWLEGQKRGVSENKKKKGIPPPPLNPSPYPSPFPDLGKNSQMQFPIAKMYISHFMARRLRSAQPCLRVAVSHLPDSSEGKKVAQTDRQSSSCQTRRLRLLLLALTRRPG